jgi:hypothetical protein
MPIRESTSQDDLADSETSRRLGNQPLLDNLKGSPWVAGLEGTQTRKGGGRRGEVDAGVGTATSARRRYAAGGTGALSGRMRVNVRARACTWVRTRVGVSDTGLGPALAEDGRHGGGRGGVQVGAMGGGGQGDRSQAQTRVCGNGDRW